MRHRMVNMNGGASEIRVKTMCRLIMALTLNYLRHGQYFPVISEYLDYINSMDKKSVSLKSNETRLSLVVEGDEGGEVQSVSFGNYRRYTIPGTKTVRNRTKLFRLKGKSGNYIEIGVPGHSWIHVKRPGDKTYSIYKTGNVIIHVGDRVFFTSAVSYAGKEGMTYAEEKEDLLCIRLIPMIRILTSSFCLPSTQTNVLSHWILTGVMTAEADICGSQKTKSIMRRRTVCKI